LQELGLVKGKMRSVLLLVSVLLLSLTVSCIVPIPKKVGTRGEITKRALEFLEEGVTSREQVLLHLGEPDFVGENEQIFVWEWVQAWDVHWGVAVGAGGEFSVRRCNGLLIKFNDQANVQAVERWDENMADDEACKFGGQLFLSTNEYTNYVHGFSIQFPPEWRVVKGSSLGELDASDFPKDLGVRDGALFMTASKGEGFFGLSFLWLSIAAYPIAEELDIWEVRPEPSALPSGQKLMMKFWMSIFALKEPDTIIVNLLDSGRTTVNGSHAIWVKHQIESQDSTLPKISLTYSFVHDRKLFQISEHWDKEHEGDKYKQDIEEVIRSFRFIR